MIKTVKFRRKILALLLFLILAVSSAFLSWTHRFVRAADCDLTGHWIIDAQISSPSTTTNQLLADIVQESDGFIQGTVTDAAGQNSTPISARLTGDQFVSDPIHVVTENYIADITFQGTVNETCNTITGTLSGYLTSPLYSPLEGTFSAGKSLSLTCFNHPSPLDGGDFRSWADRYRQADTFDVSTDGQINAFEAGYLIVNWNQPCY